jgi:hypothetical protein
MIIELACLGVLYKCGKRLVANHKSIPPKKFQPRVEFNRSSAENKDDELTSMERGKKYGYVLEADVIKRNLRRKVKREMWKEMGLED